MELLADIQELKITYEAGDLTEKLLEEGVVPQKAATDAAHIAVAAVNGMDFLLT